MSVSIPDTSSAIAPAAHSERADTSLGKKPRSGPRNCTASRNVLVNHRLHGGRLEYSEILNVISLFPDTKKITLKNHTHPLSNEEHRHSRAFHCLLSRLGSSPVTDCSNFWRHV
jgi:hypothetical protein